MNNPIKKAYTKNLMKAKLLLWIKGLEDWQDALIKELDIPAKYADDYTNYKIVDVKNVAGVPAFEFHFDAGLYELINGYRNDGFMAVAGQDFEAITDGTGWTHEAIEPSREYFIKNE